MIRDIAKLEHKSSLPGGASFGVSGPHTSCPVSLGWLGWLCALGRVFSGGPETF